MVATIQKWGNSQGLRFPKVLLEEAQIQLGEEVRLFVEDGRIVVEPVRRIRGRYKLEDLLADYQDSEDHDIADWGERVGDEVW